MLMIIAALSLGMFDQVRDTSLVSPRVFETVIEHAAVRYPSRPGLPVVISDRTHKRECIPHCPDTTRGARSIPADVVRELQASRVIVGSCSGGMGCPGYPGHTFLRLSIPYRVPAGFRVLPGEGNPSIVLGTATDRGEIVHVGVEVLVYGPCPKERQPCEYPDIVIYQYFLQEQSDGSYRVVSRVITGAV